MPEINVTKPFKYAFEGHRVVKFEKGKQDVPVEVADLAIEEEWAEPVSKEPDPATMDEIIDALGQLDPDKDEHWTSDKKPQVKAIEELLGKDISAAQRDDAWKKVQEAQD